MNTSTLILPTMTQTVFATTENPVDESLVSNNITTTVAAVIMCLVFLLGLPGNLFIVWSILACSRRHNVTTFLILNLAIADGCLMPLTIFIVVYLTKQTWVFGNVMCKGVFYLVNINMYASVFLITLMSGHRFVAVLLPTKVRLLTSTRIVKRVVVCMWLFVLIISIPSVLFRNIRNELNMPFIVCDPNHILPQYARYQYVFETTVGFIFPYAIIITSYVLILRRLRKTKFSKKVREKLILAIVVTFGIFWLPYHVINMIQETAEWYDRSSSTHKKLDHIVESSRAVTSALALISSCVNPFLYTLAGKSYIRQNGLAFMARLFEGTFLDQSTESDVGLNNVLSENNTAPCLIQKGTNTGS